MSKKRRNRDLEGKLCAYCGIREAEHRDHVVPSSRGGSNQESNLVPACGYCNMSKGNRTPSEWLSTIIERARWYDEPCSQSCRCCLLLSNHPSMHPKEPTEVQRAVMRRWEILVQIERRAVVDELEA